MTAIPSLMALRCFDSSARHTSFTKAAQEVHLTQGAVSHQILGLEAQLGVVLFVRRKSGLQLTAAGRAYWVEVSAALRQLERATQNLVLNKGQGGSLNLYGAPSFTTYWLMPRLGSFVSAHPEVILNLSTHIGPVNFTASSHDAAIEYCGGAEPGLCAEFIYSLELRPYCKPQLLPSSRKRKQTAPDRTDLARLLTNTPLIRHSTVPEAWPAWLAQAHLNEAVTATSLSTGPRYDLLSMALNGAIAGLGVALLPDYIATTAEEAGQIVRLSETKWVSASAYYLRYPEWKADMPSLKIFRDWLQLSLNEREALRTL